LLIEIIVSVSIIRFLIFSKKNYQRINRNL
jgi:hypothetical protein